MNCPAETISLADYLLKKRSSGLRARHGKLEGKRVIFFKGTRNSAKTLFFVGKSAINSLMKENYQKYNPKFPEVSERRGARNTLQALLNNKLILKCTKINKDNSARLSVCKDQIYDEQNYYVWLYQGSQLLSYIAAAGMLIVILTFVFYPLWPSFMKTGAWYGSMSMMSFLGFLLALGVIRFIFWVMSKVFMKPGVWIFPNLFEDCGFFESFVPVWAWDIPPPKRPSKKTAKMDCMI